MNDSTFDDRVVAGHYTRTTSTLVHGYLLDDDYLLNRTSVKSSSAPLCLMKQRNYKRSWWEANLMRPDDDYVPYRAADGSGIYPTKGVDFVSMIGEKGGKYTACDECSVLVSQQQESNYSWDYVLLMVEYEIPFGQWDDYVGYPLEWFHALRKD